MYVGVGHTDIKCSLVSETEVGIVQITATLPHMHIRPMYNMVVRGVFFVAWEFSLKS